MTTLIDWFEGGAGQGWGHLLQHMLGSGDYNEKFGHFSQKSQRIYKKIPQYKSIWPHPCPAHNSVYQGSHCSDLQLLCKNLIRRLYSFSSGRVLKELERPSWCNSAKLNFEFILSKKGRACICIWSIIKFSTY